MNKLNLEDILEIVKEKYPDCYIAEQDVIDILKCFEVARENESMHKGYDEANLSMKKNISNITIEEWSELINKVSRMKTVGEFKVYAKELKQHYNNVSDIDIIKLTRGDFPERFEVIKISETEKIKELRKN